MDPDLEDQLIRDLKKIFYKKFDIYYTDGFGLDSSCSVSSDEPWLGDLVLNFTPGDQKTSSFGFSHF